MENNKNTDMNTSSIENISSEEDFLVQKTVKNGLIALSLVVIFLSIVALWIVFQINSNRQEVDSLSEQAHLLHMMRINARERSLLSYEMATEKDDFKKDDYRMAVYSAGAKFTQARLKFRQKSLTKSELVLLAKQDELAAATSALLDDILDLVIKGEKELVLELLHTALIPSQAKVIKIIDRLSLSIDERYNELKLSSASINNASVIVLLAIIIIVIVGVVYIIRQTSKKISNIIVQVSATRLMLQKTIHELIQQKTVLDSHAIVSIADAQGIITYVNDKFCEISGYQRDELIGKNHRILKSGKHPDELYHELWATISQGEIWQGKICNQRKDGSYYWVESTISPFLDTKGIPYQYVSIRTDITGLLEAKNNAEEANKAKSLFLESMSHELRTPMNAILGFSQLLSMQVKDDISRQNIQEITNAGNHLLVLINEILDLSKIESGKLELSVSDYSLKDILSFCLMMVQASADEMMVNIDNKVESLADIKIKIDEQRFKQVILNLLSNAIKYNNKEGRVTVNYSVEDNAILKLSVTDTGSGLNPEQQEHIFHRFDRAGNEASNISGSGLGLVISKNLIEKMNGAIGFESAEGKGSCFWVTVPMS